LRVASWLTFEIEHEEVGVFSRVQLARSGETGDARAEDEDIRLFRA
jgi:hypothetical protein